MLRVLEGLVRLVFPPKCIFCGAILSTEAELEVCSGCFSKIPFTSGAFTSGPGDRMAQGGCDAVICLCHYTGLIKDAIVRYKFFNKSGYYRTFSKLLVKKLKKMTNYSAFDIIISVPLHKERENTRGYNQSRLISRVLSTELGLPEKSRLLSRVRYTESQSLLAGNKRRVNVRDAFRVNHAESIRGKRVLLVDDVMTTGSTLDECSKTLKTAGAKAVVGAVIASGRRM